MEVKVGGEHPIATECDGFARGHAVAIMGKPAYDLFKRTVLKSLRVRASS